MYGLRDQAPQTTPQKSAPLLTPDKLVPARTDLVTPTKQPGPAETSLPTPQKLAAATRPLRVKLAAEADAARVKRRDHLLLERLLPR